MGALTEAEIFDCLSTNFRLAAEHCVDLAKLPAKGPTYKKLREELRLIEGACRQASVHREDTRFLSIGMKCGHVHKVAGDWLRGMKMPDGSRRMIRPGELHPLFVKLAEVLYSAHLKAEEVRHKRTGRNGMILPKVQPGPHRDTRPVGFRATQGGILIPESTSMH
jgi:hypothetical protein